MRFDDDSLLVRRPYHPVAVTEESTPEVVGIVKIRIAGNQPTISLTSHSAAAEWVCTTHCLTNLWPNNSVCALKDAMCCVRFPDGPLMKRSAKTLSVARPVARSISSRCRPHSRLVKGVAELDCWIGQH